MWTPYSETFPSSKQTVFLTLVSYVLPLIFSLRLGCLGVVLSSVSFAFRTLVHPIDCYYLPEGKSRN